LSVCDMLFPYSSWPWTLGHEGTLVATGGSPTAGAEIQRVMSSGETGPIGCLAIARALAMANADISRSVAEVGLARLSAAEFAKDFRVLFQTDRAGAKMLNELVQGVGELTEKELADLGTVLPAGAVEPIRYIWR